MRTCIRCNIKKSLSDFYKKGTHYYGECKVCMNTRNIARITHLKYQLVQYKGGACEQCGYDRNLKALEFHHRDPLEKDFGIATKRNVSFEQLKSEVDKCILLCSNCHREIHDAIWRSSELVNWGLYEELVVSYELPYYGEMGSRENNYCIDCNVLIAYQATRCVSCNSKTQERIQWPSKEELEQMVWSKPTHQIAKDFGVSDNAIGKRCKKLGISKPPRGYWRKLCS